MNSSANCRTSFGQVALHIKVCLSGCNRQIVNNIIPVARFRLMNVPFLTIFTNAWLLEKSQLQTTVTTNWTTSALPMNHTQSCWQSHQANWFRARILIHSISYAAAIARHVLHNRYINYFIVDTLVIDEIFSITDQNNLIYLGNLFRKQPIRGTHSDLVNDLADLRLKAHVQHPVSFVQHKIGASS